MKTLGPQNGAFRKRSRKWIFRKRRFRIRILFACEHGIRISSAPVSKAIKNGLPKRWILLHVHLQSLAETGSSSFLFVWKGVAFENKTEDGCCCLQKQLYLVVFLEEGRLFCFCFILLRLLFVFHFAFGAFLLSPASMIHKLRTLLPRGTST